MWHLITGSLGYIARGLSQVAFPNVCVCCGVETTEAERQLCSFCKEERFEAANPDYQPGSDLIILPEGVTARHALWKFDKGGQLQHLLHYLKYERLTGIGIELGRMLGESLLRHPRLIDFMHNSSLLVPVPLHFVKFRKRGFNQAFMIARGIEEVCNVPICPVDAVVRNRNTRSQTGFSLRQRMDNIRNAFSLVDEGVFSGKHLIIVDDVFTTGSTTCELACELRKSGCKSLCIATIAQA